MNNTTNPFDQSSLDKIFKFDSKQKSRIISRESTSLEFKSSFNLGSLAKYAKDFAAFSNARGGYIIFGVKDSPHILIGLNGNKFDKLDPEKITGYLNSKFSPEIKWDMHSTTIKRKKVGIIYIHEAEQKPIMCRDNDAEVLKEGDIYYRYNARSERIKFPELRRMLEEAREREKERWIDLLEKVAKIGVSEIGLLDFKKGEVLGRGGSLLIAEDLLEKIKFIREGSFVEKEGAPTLKLIGDIKPVEGTLIQPMKEVEKPLVITTKDIVFAFLDRKDVQAPLEYVKHICTEASAFLPVHFLIKQSGEAKEKIIAEIKRVTTRSRTKQKLLERLQKEEVFSSGRLDTGTDAAKKKLFYIEKIKKRKLPKKLNELELRYFFQAITHISNSEFDPGYLFPILRSLFEKEYEFMDSTNAEAMRKALCHLDVVMYA